MLFDVQAGLTNTDAFGICEPQVEASFTCPAGTEYAPNGASAGGEPKYFTSSSPVAYRMNFATSVRNLHVQLVTADTNPNVTLMLYKWNRNYGKQANI